MAVTYRPNRQGVIEVMRSPQVASEVNRHASGAARTAGDMSGAPGGYTVSSRQGRSRFRAIVYATSMKAKRREATGNYLVRALG